MEIDHENRQSEDAKESSAGARLPASLSVWTGYLLNRAAQRCQETFDRLMEPERIRARHFRILALLGEAQPLSQVEIGERLGIDRNTVVLLLDDLEELAYVARRRDPQDRRAHCVSLTESGNKVLAIGLEKAQRTNEAVFSSLTREEREHLHVLLRRLVEEGGKPGNKHGDTNA